MNVPPQVPSHSPYPRQAGPTGTIEDLEQTLKAFRAAARGFGIAFGSNLLGYAIGLAIFQATKEPGTVYIGTALGIIGAAVATRWAAMQYAQAMQKNEKVYGTVALFAPIVPCAILVGFAVMQQNLINKLKAVYQVRYGFLGIKKNDLEAARVRLAQPPFPTFTSNE